MKMGNFTRSMIGFVLLLSGGGHAGAATFSERCQANGVVRCVAFDSPSDFVGLYGDNTGVLAGMTTAERDTTVKASGDGSIKFTIPSNSGSDTSGTYFANFSDDLSVQFGGNSQFYVQWRQRFSPEFLNTVYTNGGGWKQVIIGSGDKPGCTSSNSGSGLCYSSCSDLETVVQNTAQRGFPQMYNSCSGSTSHGPFEGFEESFGNSDYKMQNARPAPYCLFSQEYTNPQTLFPPAGNCFGYFANEWMTFQVGITLGPRVGDEFVDSNVKLWVARDGSPSELVIDWGPYNLTAGSPSEGQEFGKVWLLPYHTDKSSGQSHPTGYTWYDELIISTSKIADPDGGVVDNVSPAAPQNLQAD